MSSNTNTRKAILIRTSIVFSGMLVFALFVIFKLFNIQFVEGNMWRKLSQSLGTNVFNIEAERGSIFDCEGNLLATSLPIYDLIIDAQAPNFQDEEVFNENIDSLSFQLAKLFHDKTAFDYKKQLTSIRKQHRQYNLFKRKVSYHELRALYTFPIFKTGKNKGGLVYEKRSKREKPFGILAERTIGFKQEKGSIRVGLEGFFDESLSGKSGKRAMQKIAGGTWVPLDDESMIEAQQGKDIITSIDINLQDVAENALMSTLIENDADYGTAILMEVATGDLKAIANLSRESAGKYVEKYNYAIGENVEPGSTFKLVSALALLEDGFESPESTIDAEGGSKVFCNMSKPMIDSHKGIHMISLQKAFEQSSNIAFGKFMQKNYSENPQKIYAHYKALGLTEKINLQLFGVGVPKVKGPLNKSWSCTSLPYMATGYELEITPLQLLMVYNAIANNGVLVKPQLVKKLEQDGRVVKNYPTVVLNPKVCRPEVAKQLQNMMEGVVLRGTANKLKSDFYTYAGKTGTAVIALNGKGYLDGGGSKSYRASFCGYFPAQNPRYSCLVLISRPRKENYYAAEVALPVFKEIADKVYASSLTLHQELKFIHPNPSEDLPKIKLSNKVEMKEILNWVKLSSHYHNDSISEDETEWVQGEIQDKSIAFQPIVIKAQKMPDVRGMGAKDALYLLEKKGVKVSLKGIGKVKKQSVAPGVQLKKFQNIQLQLG